MWKWSFLSLRAHCRKCVLSVKNSPLWPFLVYIDSSNLAPTISNRKWRKAIFFWSFNWVKDGLREIGCMQVIFLVICSRLLPLYVGWWMCNVVASIYLKGKMKKHSHLHHNGTFFAVIIYDEYSLTAVVVLCDVELLSLGFAFSGQKLFSLIFCLHFVYSKHKLTIVMYHLPNVECSSFFPFRVERGLYCWWACKNFSHSFFRL